VQKLFENDMLCLQKILNCSPVGSTINHWVDLLATIISHEVEKAEHCYLQCDHAPDGSLAKVLTYFELKDKTKKLDGSVQHFFLV